MAKRETAHRAGKPSEIPKVDLNSADVLADRLVVLKEHFPEVFTEGKVDFDRLKNALGASLETNGERYGLSWAGKTDCFREIQTPTSATLVPVRDQSVEFDTTQNVFIEGENLQVLKILQKSYYGRVKMIYIDPPYNTGNDTFIYPDKFKEDRDGYLRRSGQLDEMGNLITDGVFRKNTRDAGHFHSNWLNMMYPRLFLARNLLREDGVIFVSIDDTEVENLRMIMNEIFGEENFVAQVVWKKSYGGGSKVKHVVGLHEYILIFAKSKELIENIDLPPDPKARKYYTEKDDKFETRGPYRLQPLATTSMDVRPNLRYSIRYKGNDIWPEKQWQWAKERVDNALKNDELVFAKEKGKWTVNYKQYLYNDEGEERGAKPFTVLNGPYTQVGTGEISELFENPKVFAFPKPISLVQHFLHYFYQCKDAIILDFFAGSCTTAHAVIQLNTDDGGNRRIICVQMAEPCDPDSEAYKAGFKTIADIGKERIRRAAAKIKKETQGKLDFDGAKLDLGFKVFRAVPSHFKVWDGEVQSSDKLARNLWEHVDNVDHKAGDDELLYELLVKTGQDLNALVEKAGSKSGTYYRINGGELIVCLAATITQALVDTLRAEKPKKIIFLDRAFKNNDQLKTNTHLQMGHDGIDFKVV